MTNLLRTIIFLISACYTLHGQQLNTPLLITGKVYNHKGEQIDKESLRFKVFLDEKPDFYLDQFDVSCGYNPPIWFVELGNLQTPWHFGDLLIIIIEDIDGKENKKFSWTIDSSAHVPDIQTNPIDQNNLITQFGLSDKGVFHNVPVRFTFRSVFTQLPKVELKIYSYDGQEVFKYGEPESIDFDLFQFTWDGKSSRGQQLVSGLYYYFFTVNEELFHSGIITLKNE